MTKANTVEHINRELGVIIYTEGIDLYTNTRTRDQEINTLDQAIVWLKWKMSRAEKYKKDKQLGWQLAGGVATGGLEAGIGAGVGAAAGSIVPGIGTAVGAIAGFVVGGALGAVTGVLSSDIGKGISRAFRWLKKFKTVGQHRQQAAKTIAKHAWAFWQDRVTNQNSRKAYEVMCLFFGKEPTDRRLIHTRLPPPNVIYMEWEILVSDLEEAFRSR